MEFFNRTFTLNRNISVATSVKSLIVPAGSELHISRLQFHGVNAVTSGSGQPYSAAGKSAYLKLLCNGAERFRLEGLTMFFDFPCRLIIPPSTLDFVVTVAGLSAQVYQIACICHEVKYD